MTPAPGVAFLACIERGRLEQQGLLLCRSIRRGAGRFTTASIHAFQPRAGTDAGAETVSALRDLDVIHHTDTLNRDFHDYPIGNKIFACAWAAQNLQEDILVFLDSDTFFANEPERIHLASGLDAAARPVDRKRIGSTGPRDPNEAYWKPLYAKFGIANDPCVETIVDGETIRAYFNSGLVAARRSAGIFEEWLDIFRRLMEGNHLPPNGSMQFMDQVALALVLSRRFDRVSQLDWRYNLPLPQRARLSDPARTARLEDMIHIHYHRWFNKPNFLRLLRPPLDLTGDVSRWVEDSLPFQPTIDDPMKFRGVETGVAAAQMNPP